MPTSPEIFATADSPFSDACACSLAADLADAFGPDRLVDGDGKGGIYCEPEAEYHLLPEAPPRAVGILCVRLCTSYYGKGYERGHWPEIATTLEFLRHRLPSARVWYGPDGTGIVQEVTREFLDEMWAYWATHGGRPYHKK